MTTFGPYPAVVFDVHDGDTVTLVIDLGWDLTLKGRCRVYGINAPELSTKEGQAARDYARVLLPLGEVVRVLSHDWDKYGGRFDGDLTLPDGRDFATLMVESGHAIRKNYTTGR